MPKRRVNKVQYFKKLKKEVTPGPFTSENEIKRFCTRLMMIQKINVCMMKSDMQEFHEYH